MKSNKLIFPGLILSIAILFSSCNFFGNCIEGEGIVVTKTVIVEDFDQINVSSSVKVFLTQSTEQKVTINAPQNIIDILSTNVRGSEWKIDFDRCVNTLEPIEIYIELPRLLALEVEGSGDVVSKGTIKSDELELTIDGSGSINLDLNVKELTTDINGSGDINLTGVTKLNNIEINGSGDVKAYDLLSDETEIEINGSGDVEVNVSYALKVDINGSGDVYYKGDVKEMDSNINGSGKLNQQK